MRTFYSLIYLVFFIFDKISHVKRYAGVHTNDRVLNISSFDQWINIIITTAHSKQKFVMDLLYQDKALSV